MLKGLTGTGAGSVDTSTARILRSRRNPRQEATARHMLLAFRYRQHKALPFSTSVAVSQGGNMNATLHGVRRPSWALAAVGTRSLAFALLTGGAGTAAADEEQAGDGPRGHAENIILFVGDGPGVAQRDAGALYELGVDGSLVMDTLPFAGLVETDSADPEDFVTDSAAAATSYAAGIKTYNGAISMDLDNNPGRDARRAGRESRHGWRRAS